MTENAYPDAQRFETGSVVSPDGTTVGFRRLGSGPALVAVHGGAQAAQNLMALAESLADSFTVYLPDRRGRGLSGPLTERYGLAAECEDLAALLAETGAERLFGLSSGAIICLQTAMAVPGVRKLALYEPPLSIDHSTPTGWVERFERECAQGKLGSAMTTAARGTKTAPLLFRLLPRFVVAGMLNKATRTLPEEALAKLPESYRQKANPADVPLAEIVPTMRYDAQVVMDSESTLDTFAGLTADVLLLGGDKSAAYLKKSLAALGGVLPRSHIVVFPGLGHLGPDNAGDPARVAAELRAFLEPDV
jgi:pimeloyl-ACP methyl ester carboxylesterase